MPKISHSIATLLLGTAACCAPVMAQATQQQGQAYDLPAQDMGDALLEVAKIAGVELYAASTSLEGKTAPPLRGTFGLDEALDRLLKGSGLKAKVDGRAIIISQASDTAPDDAGAEDIVVTGSRIAGTPATAPVVRITSEDILNAGQNDLGEVARSLPQNFGGGQNPGIGNSQGAANENVNANGASTFNLSRSYS